MTDIDLQLIYKKFEELDKELRQIRNEVNQLKPTDFYQAKAYSATTARSMIPQWEENIMISKKESSFE